MIFGNCPHCGFPTDFEVPDGLSLPTFGKYECDKCHKEFYEYLSRINPSAYKPEELIIDEKNHSIKIKAML